MKERLSIELVKIKKEFENLIKKQGKQKIITYLYIIFSLMAITVFGLFAIAPTASTISELHKEKDDGEFTLEQLGIKNQALQKLSSEYGNVEPVLDKIYAAIPSSPKIPEVIRKIEILANRNSLAVQNLSTGAIELYPTSRPGTQIFSYTINVSALGTETSINTFIQELINTDRIISVERLNSGISENNLFSTTITGRAYFIKE